LTVLLLVFDLLSVYFRRRSRSPEEVYFRFPLISPALFNFRVEYYLLSGERERERDKINIDEDEEDDLPQQQRITFSNFFARKIS
jgi:hypothetical protein